MQVTYHVILRPDTPDEKKARGLPDRDSMDAWVRQHGRPGDRVRWFREGPTEPAAGAPNEYQFTG
ncbi:MAG: hypothetical protein JWO37_183 [Acidimicrobiales bacterium]|jgi:hypothetical protein|nr:hypothetical protein [Acidimicrobiales bacterium]